MTVLPGSLDYLYYNGILDHIPYEAYEYGFANPYGGMINPYSGLKQSITGVGYLNAARGGLLYDTYNSKDTFVRRDMSGFGSSAGDNYSIIKSSYGESGANFINSIRNAGARIKETVSNASPSSIWKGLAAAGLIIATPILIIKGRKNSAAELAKAAEDAVKPSFWSRLNPKNWFRK